MYFSSTQAEVLFVLYLTIALHQTDYRQWTISAVHTEVTVLLKNSFKGIFSFLSGITVHPFAYFRFKYTYTYEKGTIRQSSWEITVQNLSEHYCNSN